MARRNRDQNVPETVVTDEEGKPAFPDPPDNRSSLVPGPGLIKCICITKCFRGGLVRPGEIRYFREVPEHFEEADDGEAIEAAFESVQPRVSAQAVAEADAARLAAEKANAERFTAEAEAAKAKAEKEAAEAEAAKANAEREAAEARAATAQAEADEAKAAADKALSEKVAAEAQSAKMTAEAATAQKAAEKAAAEAKAGKSSK